jgi:hypothetical protein
VTSPTCTGQRDSAPAVLERHYWRTVNRCVQAIQTPAPTPPGAGRDGLTVWTVDSLRAAAQHDEQVTAARHRMFTAGHRAQSAGLRWLRHVALVAARTQTTAAPVVQSTDPCAPFLPERRRWGWQLPTLEHSEHRPLSRRSNAPNLPAQISTYPGAQPT